MRTTAGLHDTCRSPPGSIVAHEAGLRRVEQAGAQLTSITQLLCELQRDWARKSTVPAFVDLLFKKTPEPQAA